MTGIPLGNPMLPNFGRQPIPQVPPAKWQSSLSGLLGSIGQAFMAPGNAMAGNYDQLSIDQNTGAVSQIDPRMIGDASNLAGMVTLGAGAAPAEANALNMGIRAYHGSPHSFEKFDTSKIGTGEGAQAYGHGLYFSENEAVANSYRDKLAKNNQRQAAGPHLPGNPFSDAPILEADPTRPGAVYSVDINAEPANFVDYDAPINKQPSAARDAIYQKLGDLGYSANARGLKAFQIEMGGFGEPMGTTLQKVFGSPEAASAALAKAGVPGIKYLDQGSRAKGSGTRNYVVFDDKLVNVLKKYGIAGSAGLGAVMSAMQNKKPAPTTELGT